MSSGVISKEFQALGGEITLLTAVDFLNRMFFCQMLFEGILVESQEVAMVAFQAVWVAMAPQMNFKD